MINLTEWAEALCSTRDEKEILRQLKRLIGFVKEGGEIRESKLECGFCRDPLPDGSIPACGAPATRQVRGVMFGEPQILDICDNHFEKMKEYGPREVTKIFGPFTEYEDHSFDRVSQYFYTNDIKEYRCKGCGKPIVRAYSKGLLSGGAGPLDGVVAMDHLNVCPWRRTEMGENDRKAVGR